MRLGATAFDQEDDQLTGEWPMRVSNAAKRQFVADLGVTLATGSEVSGLENDSWPLMRMATIVARRFPGSKPFCPAPVPRLAVQVAPRINASTYALESCLSWTAVYRWAKQ
jgi:hypothetical protein